MVECYWPGVDERQLRAAVDRTGEMTTWHVSILIPEDEIVLCVVDGASPEEIRAAALQAGLPAERIVTCIHVARPSTP